MPGLEDRVSAQIEEQLLCGAVLDIWSASVLHDREVDLRARCAIRM